jgi:phosphoribosylanthranilate isomerase
MTAARVKVKICGLTSAADARAAAEAGADAVGLVFWSKSPRAVDVPAARVIAAALPPFVLRVGVFVDASPEDLARAVDEVGLDLVQLHGQEPPESLDALPRRALKAVHLLGEADLAPALRYAERGAGLLVDARSADRPGGTGAPCDWPLARRLREQVPFLVLAGGLDPGNVAAAVAAVRPDAVDVSSGVEAAPGRKDRARMRAFVEALRSVAS